MSSTIDDFRAGIKLADLPQTFVDAVVLTRELGISYLWIDAFCIIQDSDDDWRRESTKMSDIYAGAELTIAASSAASAAEGFLDFSTSNASDVDYRIFQGSIPSAQGLLPVKARVIHPLGIHWRWEDLEDEYVQEEPLSRRGWTLQERILSRRLVSFSNAEMQWSCHGGVGCECQSELNLNRQFGGVPLSQVSEHREAFRYWQKMVESYSRRALTNARDKLPAASGVAEVIQRITKSGYVAGLWRDNIDLDLLWRRKLSESPVSPVDPQAPSFSWASALGEIDYYCFRNGKQHYEKASSVISVTAVSDPSAPLGQVHTGRLEIRGPLQQGAIENVAEDGWFQVRFGDWIVELTADAALEQTQLELEGSDILRTVLRNVDPPSLARGADQLRQDLKGATIWGLRLGSFPFASGNAPRDDEILILGKLPGESNVFQRLGLGSKAFATNGDEEEVWPNESINTITII